MNERYFVDFDVLTNGDSDCSRFVEISKDQFDKLKPFEAELRNGNRTVECENVLNEMDELEDMDLRPSEIDALINDHNYIYVAVC